jgi:hypothetical protein
VSALILGLILVVGYRYQAIHPIKRYLLTRNTGYNLYFRAGFSGLILAYFAIMSWAVIDAFDYPSTLADATSITKAINQGYRSEMKAMLIVAIACFWCYSLAWLRSFWYWCFPEKKLERICKIADELEKLVLTSYGIDWSKALKPVRVVMDSEKAYVGLLTEPDFEGGKLNHLSIIPLLSGYLNSKKDLKFTNNYYNHYKGFYNIGDGTALGKSQNGRIEDFIIIIPVEKVQLISHFDVDAYLNIHNDSSELTENSS